jgi:hypothetical protein
VFVPYDLKYLLDIFSQLKGARRGVLSLNRAVCTRCALARTHAVPYACDVRRAIDCSVSKLDPALVDDSSKPAK